MLEQEVQQFVHYHEPLIIEVHLKEFVCDEDCKIVSADVKPSYRWHLIVMIPAATGHYVTIERMIL